MPMMRRTYRRRPMMRRRRIYRRRFSKKVRWQAKARRMVGNPKNYSTSKTTETVNPGTATGVSAGSFTGTDALDTKTINSIPLIQIAGTSVNSINARQRDMCVVSGVKIDATFRNNISARVYVNWAVVHGKQGQLISPATEDFFRDYQSERTFNADHIGKTGLTSSVAQINTDEFVVLKRGKFMLSPLNGPSGAQQTYNYGGVTKEKSIWLKLGRSFYFDDSSSQPQDQMYFVTWVANPEEVITVRSNDVLNIILRSVVYWREPRGA